MTTTEPLPQTGKLVVRYISQSAFLTHQLPIEVRDAKYQVVETLRGRESSTDLAPGPYTVSATLDDGRLDTRRFSIVPNGRVVITFNTSTSTTLESFTPKTTDVVLAARVVGSKPLESLTFLPDLQGSTADVVSCSRDLDLRQQGDGVIRATVTAARMTEPAWVKLGTPAETVWLGLPIHERNDASRTCALRLAQKSRALRVEIEMSSDRLVTRTLYKMAESGRIGAALELADTHEAVHLLFGKYSDPVGAVYGALFLQRFGLLAKRASWVENLGRDFAWLPDARVILAAVLAASDKPADRDRGCDALLAATARPLFVFSEAFSLALSLLRRWPDEARAKECRHRLAELSDTTSHFDFSAPFATVRWKKA